MRTFSRRLRFVAAALMAGGLLAASSPVPAQEPVRARDLGVVLPGTPGPLNAITDVEGVTVGHTTLIAGEGPLLPGAGPVRTGVTAILPRGASGPDAVFASWYRLNGNGEMTGLAWLEESGVLESPILITNTHSVGVVRDATIEWLLRRRPSFLFALPVVAETADLLLNDMNGFHVRPEHVFAALDGARSGRLTEGNVGGGTGMICHAFKGGIGTASRVVTIDANRYTVGVLVQCNYGSRARLRIEGVPVGARIPVSEVGPCFSMAPDPAVPEFLRGLPRCGAGPRQGANEDVDTGSACWPTAR